VDHSPPLTRDLRMGIRSAEVFSIKMVREAPNLYNGQFFLENSRSVATPHDLKEFAPRVKRQTTEIDQTRITSSTTAEGA